MLAFFTKSALNIPDKSIIIGNYKPRHIFSFIMGQEVFQNR